MKFQFIKESKTYRLTQGDDLSSVTVPSIYEGYPVTEIGEKAFAGFSKLQTIAIPSSIQVIGMKAFYRVKSLKNVAFSSGLKQIEKEAFLSTSLKSVVLPDSLIFIGPSAFHDNSLLQEIKLPNHLTELSKHVLSYCVNLKNITLPQSLKYIRSDALQSCENLETITIPHGVKSIEDSAFCMCSSLKKVVLQEGLEEIHHKAFLLYGDLKEIKLPNSLRMIGEEAFKSAGLVAISIPGSVKEIKKQAFSDNKLINIKIQKGLEIIGQKAFEFNKSLKEIILPSTLKKIDSFAFQWCSALKEVQGLSDKITLGKGVFSHTAHSPKKESILNDKPAKEKKTEKKATKTNISKSTPKSQLKSNSNQKHIDIADFLDNTIVEIAKTIFPELLELQLAKSTNEFLELVKKNDEDKAHKILLTKSTLKAVLLETRIKGSSKLLDEVFTHNQTDETFMAKIYQNKLKNLSNLPLGKILKNPLIAIDSKITFPEINLEEANLVTDYEHVLLWGAIINQIQKIFQINDFFEIIKTYPSQSNETLDLGYIYFNNAKTFGAIILLNDDYKTITLSPQMFFYPPNEQHFKLIEYPNFVQKLIYSKIYTGKEVVFKP